MNWTTEIMPVTSNLESAVYDGLFGNVSELQETSTVGLEENRSGTVSYGLELDASLQIGLYVLIFLLAVIGNVLVILTLVQNLAMRTITNLFLLNLAISDLFVGVLCMPFSLVGIVLKDFVFGPILCKLIPYLQAVSVSVSAWTLVAISVERYYAICHPLTSRQWQTLSHAYKIIGIVWILSGLSMLPIATVNELQPIRDTGRHKCREEWGDYILERAYTIFLDLTLLVLPLGIMSVKYSLITRTLWQVTGGNPTTEQESSNPLRGANGIETPPTPAIPRSTIVLSNTKTKSRTLLTSSPKDSTSKRPIESRTSELRRNLSQKSRQSSGEPLNPHRPAVLRRCNMAKSLRRKKRVIQMLGVVVAEFFVCWTPLYIMNTWYLFSPTELYQMIGPFGVSLIQLVAYLSSCVNPITYCFMNVGFRIAFFNVFGCRSPRYSPSNQNQQSFRLTRRTVYHSTSKSIEIN